MIRVACKGTTASLKLIAKATTVSFVEIQKRRACGAARKKSVRTMFAKIVSTKDRSNVELTIFWSSKPLIARVSSVIVMKVKAANIQAWFARENQIVILVFA